MISVAWCEPKKAARPHVFDSLHDDFRFSSLREIANEVCRKHKVAFRELVSSQRPKYIVVPRHEFMWRAREETNYSLHDIGRFLGGRDHSTVAAGIERHKARMGL